MREVIQRRRVETVTRQTPVRPKPQWQNLFQAPVYATTSNDESEEAEEWMLDGLPAPRRQRGGRRVH
ncbi:hypothetical protein [Streptomyces sp. NPDC046939]|uniref:hypothetical protein n=1 Tax=Streptomyces sp. NPDC046939 TaxID=3155376 RepID=UPI0033C27B9B